jgi:hypothetical protein
MDTKPLIFKETEEPLHADEWLNTIGQKFCLLRLTEGMKAEYASHQCMVLQASGGAIIGIPCLLMLRLSGISLRKLSGGIIFLLF